MPDQEHGCLTIRFDYEGGDQRVAAGVSATWLSISNSPSRFALNLKRAGCPGAAFFSMS